MEDSNQSVPEPPAPLSLLGRLTGVLATPGEVFDAVKAAPSSTANWLVPALILLGVSWLSAFLIFSQPSISRQLTDIQSAAIEKQIAAKNMSPQQAEAMRQAVEKFGSVGTKIGMVVGPTLYALVTPFWWGLLLWGVGRVVFKVPFGYMKAVEVAGLSAVILALGAIVKTLLVVGMGNLFIGTSAVFFFKKLDPSTPTFQLLSALDVFTFWALGVRASGLARLTGTSTLKSAAWVFGLWLVFTSLLLGFSFGAQALGNSLSR
jgi:hypothetical protein